jgi:transposase
MQLQTILNRVQKHKSFVYGKARFVQARGRLSLEVEVQPRKNGRPLCSGCNRPGPGYDTLPARRFEFIPLWNILVFLVYAMRRVDCPNCGVKVEQVPWADGKSPMTTPYQWFLARWAKRLCWKQVAQAFGTTWDAVYSAVMMAVVFGLEQRSLLGITTIGVDEIQWLRGHQYLTLVYEIGAGTKRLLYIGKERTEQSLRTFFHLLGQKGSASLRYICSDMWQPYLTVIAQMAGGAIQILDRFHIMKKFNEAIDQVRREEAQRMKQQGYEPVLRHARWCLLKRPDNLTQGQASKLSELMSYNLRSVRAYLLREEFQHFWEYLRPSSAGRFLDDWCKRAMRSKLEPIKKVVGTLRGHRALLLNWFKAKGAISSGAVEGMNNNAKVVMRKAYGFRAFRAVEVALYHTLGDLPEPSFTHKFC